MRAALLCAYSAEKLFLLVVPKRLRAFRNYFFTGDHPFRHGFRRATFPKGTAFAVEGKFTV